MTTFIYILQYESDDVIEAGSMIADGTDINYCDYCNCYNSPNFKISSSLFKKNDNPHYFDFLLNRLLGMSGWILKLSLDDSNNLEIVTSTGTHYVNLTDNKGFELYIKSTR